MPEIPEPSRRLAANLRRLRGAGHGERWANDEFAAQVADHIGARIRRSRRAQELSQEALAVRASIHPAQITLIERRTRLARIDTPLKLAGGLDATLATLIEGVAWELGEGGMGAPIWTAGSEPRHPGSIGFWVVDPRDGTQQFTPGRDGAR
jgi:ribosome-binding protein aMBF1 (putative translation factor)